MPDRISQHNTVRLTLHVPTAGAGEGPWSLALVETRRGVPRTSIVASGRVSVPGGRPDVAEIAAALSEAVGAISGL